MKNSNCHNCAHLYITHKPSFPYGCRAFGIISKKVPYLEVKNISGTDCALFSKKRKSVKIFKKGRIA